ncbi:MAG: YitT family protein [Eubacteriales bacterium]|nr:YitT family protein [Eubacteriales bacterium]MDD4421635.1 YitT family protein [Eubacteriales bacterium]
MKKTALNILKNYALITVSCFIYAVGISLFLDPNRLAPGGVTGIAIIINNITDFPTGTLVLIINIPIMVIAVLKLGFKLFVSSIYALIISSFAINLLAPYGPVTDDLLLASITGAVLVGVSIGLIFRAGATTGGADIIVKLLRLRFKHIKTGRIFMISDGIVVAISGFVFKNINVALYAGISVLIQSFVLDLVLYGTDGARLLYIISDNENDIAERFMKELDVGVTYLQGRGAYTSKNKKVMLCAMRKQLLPRARGIVLQHDENAFMIVTSANQVFGEGFRRHDSIDL